MKRFIVVAVTAAAGCKEQAAAPGPGEGMPPAKVTVTVLQPVTVEETAEYLATLTSRRAVVLHPQVQGYVRSIAVKPGQEVKAGTVLMQVDTGAEGASLQNLQATRESLQSNAAFAKQRLERATALRLDGIVSQQDVDAARSAADQAEATLRASDATIASQKTRLGFFTIVAPIDGVVGDVPVKIGDFVTPQTPLTSVTQDSGLEADVQVPVERAEALGPTSRVRLLASDGGVAGDSPVTFVSPRAEASTQLVLLKGAFDAPGALRAGQVVRARVVFSTREGLAIPIGSVTRQAGQTFAFVVDDKSTAHRVPVTLGALQGNTYVVHAGLDAGVKLVTSGLQMLQDGAAVQATSSESPTPQGQR
ncbi:MAG: efflux RND transporter periplasmic adaptor subunit [Myxococcaceae bacterium]|nr:efflux RND transporter periplasmic adaptor subunit [Myxococcaceae bacterium]